MSDDMSEIMQKMSEMLKNNEIPDNVKSILNGFTSNQNNSSPSQEDISNATDSKNEQNSSDSFEMPNIDLGTMLKMKSIFAFITKTIS